MTFSYCKGCKEVYNTHRLKAFVDRSSGEFFGLPCEKCGCRDYVVVPENVTYLDTTKVHYPKAMGTP